MTVAKATRLSWGRPSQQATVWRAWASSFTRLWGPLLHERIARPRFLRNQRENRDATFAGDVAHAHAGLVPPAVALFPLPPRCCATSSSASTPSCATSAAVSPAEANRQNTRELHCMTKNVTMEVDGHEIQTPHCIQSSRFSSVLQFCIIWQVIESSD